MVQQAVEGHWRLDLPEPDTIYRIRCFTDAVSESSTARDHLELAWRSINNSQHAISTSNSNTGSFDVLYSPCATLSTTGLEQEASSRRELWVFTPVLDGMAEDNQFLHLKEVTPPLQSFCPSTFLLCARGHAACSARCRTSPHWRNPAPDTAAARISRYNQLSMNQDTPSGKIMFDVWRRFSQAALNKLAWRHGNQVSLTSMRTDLNPVLIPTAESALVLSTTKSLRLSSEGAIKQRGVQVELVPMCLPALFVAPFSGSTRDRQRLAASLSPYLSRNLGQGGPHDGEDWSIFWVPISGKQQQQVASGWENEHGVLCLWPDSLVRWDGKAYPEVGHLSSALAPPPPSVTIVTESLGLFDTIAQAEAVTPQLGTPVPPETMSHDNEGVIAMLVADDSGDDLFSAASSPLPIHSPPSPALRQGDDFEKALAEDAATSPVESDPDTVADLDPESIRAKIQNNEAGIGAITEMDFDFFDAHTPVRPSDEDPIGLSADIPPLLSSAATSSQLYEQPADAMALLVPPNPSEERHAITKTHHSALAGMTEHTCLPDEQPDAHDRAIYEGPVGRTSVSPPIASADHFQAISLRNWKYSARYHPALASSREVDRTASQHDNQLVQRLKRELLQIDFQAPSQAAWNDQSNRRAIPGQTVEITAASELSPDAHSPDDLESPPQTPLYSAQTDGLEDGQHRFCGIRCLTSEMVNLEGNSVMTTMETCPWPALANKLGPAAELPIIAAPTSGFPPSPPLSPESSFFVEDDAFLRWLVHETIWNRHFANHLMPDRLQSAKPEYIRERLPKPVSLQVMGQFSTVTPPARIRRRSMSSNRHPPTQLTPYVLRTPKLALGYLGNVVTASPESVQFWQELGVGPVGGPKDITSFSLYIGDDGSEARDNIDLVKHIGTAYEASKFGVHSAGIIKGDLSHFKSASMTNWREAIASIRASPAKTPFAVIFIFLPRMENGSLLELVSAIHSYLRNGPTIHPPTSIYHMIPPGACRHVRNAPSIALDVYNRCQHKVEAVVSRSQRKPDTAIQYPAFYLAPEGPDGWTGSQSTIFKLKWPAATHNVLRSQRTWHCGYRWCPKTEILVAVCLDASGESMESAAWHFSESNTLADVVSKLYDFCFSTSNGASRLCFCSPDPPSRALLRAWTTFIDDVVSTTRIELLCTTTDVSITCNSEDRQEIHAPSTISSSSAKLRAEAYAGSAVFLPHRCAIRLPPAAPLAPHADFVFPLASMTLLFAPAQGSSETPNLGVHVLAMAETEEIDLHGYQNDIAESFHNLRVLAALRWGCNDTVLPMHLQAVSTVACILAAR